MNYSCVELNDLPDEILLIIFKQLDNLELLYSIHGINERLNNILHDSTFTSHLSFFNWSYNECINKFSSNIIFNRFCLQILPKIHMKIKCLHLECESMKNILNAADYPNLYSLGLYNIEENNAKCFFTDEKLLSSTFTNQITKLIIGIKPDKNLYSTMEYVCNHVFTVFINLNELIFYDAVYISNVRLLSYYLCPNFSSSSLMILNIRVQTFTGCLYILDGRFDQLHTLHIELANIFLPKEEVKHQKKLPKLKFFVLSNRMETRYYNELILPLLYRMPNLEKLGLNLTISVNETFIDGNNLKKNILNHMLQLNEFTFDIYSSMSIKNQINLPSKEDIQQTFNYFQNTKIISCVDYFLESVKNGLCHIYTYPSLMKYCERITNNFPGGLYPYVRVVSLHDEHPFEHDFFIRIAQSFPFMEKLTISNRYEQKQNESYKLKNDKSNLSIVKYNSLIELIIDQSHECYIEEFLCDKKTYFKNNISFVGDYKHLDKVTHNFTRDDTKINCMKVYDLFLYGEDQYSKSCKDYFPFTIIE